MLKYLFVTIFAYITTVLMLAMAIGQLLDGGAYPESLVLGARVTGFAMVLPLVWSEDINRAYKSSKFSRIILKYWMKPAVLGLVGDGVVAVCMLVVRVIVYKEGFDKTFIANLEALALPIACSLVSLKIVARIDLAATIDP